jgi:hypothetical protein
MLARAARARRLVVVMGYNVGFGAVVTSFRPGGPTLEEVWDIPGRERASLEQVAAGAVDLGRQLGRLPGYAQPEVLKAVVEGRMSAPSVAPGVDIAAGMTATAIVGELTGRQRTPAAPRIRWFDAWEGRSGLVRWPRLGFSRSMIGLQARYLAKAGQL